MFKKGQIGIYIHWPFCMSKCPYCDFNVYLDNKHDASLWLDAYLKSIRTYSNLMPGREIVSIYFGGGTPSLMKPNEVEAIINEIQNGWPIANNVEITLEANPTSSEIDKFKSFRKVGVNRLSLGVQSLRDDVLKFLGRLHSSEDVLRAIKIADNIFERFSFDLIYALPEQTLTQWRHDLEKTIPYMKGHLSAYQLTIKQDTAFEKQEARGDFALPETDLAADFYNLTNDIMAQHNMPAYEISNYGSAGHESKHNMIYWHYQDYIGVGAGAHGRIHVNEQKYATKDHMKPSDWLNAVNENGHGSVPYEKLTPKDQFEEMLMGGLRITSGVDLKRAQAITGLPIEECIDVVKVQVLQNQGWLEYKNSQIIPNREAWLRTDSILPFILK